MLGFYSDRSSRVHTSTKIFGKLLGKQYRSSTIALGQNVAKNLWEDQHYTALAKKWHESRNASFIQARVANSSYAWQYYSCSGHITMGALCFHRIQCTTMVYAASWFLTCVYGIYRLLFQREHCKLLMKQKGICGVLFMKNNDICFVTR